VPQSRQYNIELGATRYFARHAWWIICLSFSASSKKVMAQDDNTIGHSRWRGAGEEEGSAQTSKNQGTLLRRTKAHRISSVESEDTVGEIAP
jgi:hypothetical protein